MSIFDFPEVRPIRNEVGFNQVQRSDFGARTSTFVRDASELWSKKDFVLLSRLLVENSNHQGPEARANFESQIAIVSKEISEQFERAEKFLNQLAQPLGRDPRTLENTFMQLKSVTQQLEAETVLRGVQDLSDLIVGGWERLRVLMEKVLKCAHGKHSNNLARWKFTFCCKVNQKIAKSCQLLDFPM